MSKRKRRAVAVIDAETDPFKRYRVPRPFLWGFYDGEHYLQFDDTEELALFLMQYDGIVYAHNGGKFDWHFLLDYLEPFDPIMLINGRIAQMHLGLADCRDSWNIVPVPLAAYKKDDIDYRIMEASERDKPKNRAAIEQYLRADCIYLHELVTRFIETYGLHLTQAGAAMSVWSKMSPLPVPHSSAEFYAEFSPYYYGGRVQCFESGVIDTNFAVYDINSAYPRAMLEKHPYSTNYVWDEGYKETADFYRLSCVSRGAFPYRTGGLGLHFPDDDVMREYTVTRWEYEAARDTNTVHSVTVHESCSFMSHVDFAPYIEHFWAERKAAKDRGDDAGSLFAKLLMNSLYGKWAANPDNYKAYMPVPIDVIAALDDAGWCFAGEFGPWGLAQQDLPEYRKRYYNVATGASITGYVRAMLWRAICGAGRVLYCDTDSIACVDPGDMPLGDALGQWKHEGDFDRAGIGGKKLYIFRGVPNADGVREYKTAHKGTRLTHAQLWRVANGAGVTYVPENPTFSAKRAPVLRGLEDAEIGRKMFTPRRVRKTA